MKYELKANQGIPASLLVMLSIATGLSVANCYYNQPLLGSIATDFKINVKEKGKVYDNTAKMQFINQLGA